MIHKIERIIGMNYINSIEQYYQEKQNRKDKFNARKERLTEEEIQRQKEIKKEKKQLIMKKNVEFHNYYPLFKKININYDTPRLRLISLLYDNKYKNKYINKKEFDLAMKPIDRKS